MSEKKLLIDGINLSIVTDRNIIIIDMENITVDNKEVLLNNKLKNNYLIIENNNKLHIVDGNMKIVDVYDLGMTESTKNIISNIIVAIAIPLLYMLGVTIYEYITGGN